MTEKIEQGREDEREENLVIKTIPDGDREFKVALLPYPNELNDCMLFSGLDRSAKERGGETSKRFVL